MLVLVRSCSLEASHASRVVKSVTVLCTRIRSITLTVFADHILHVVFVRAYPKMIRVAAWRVVACVTDFHVVWNGNPCSKFQGNSMHKL